jgi:hypothetical protein
LDFNNISAEKFVGTISDSYCKHTLLFKIIDYVDCYVFDKPRPIITKFESIYYGVDETVGAPCEFHQYEKGKFVNNQGSNIISIKYCKRGSLSDSEKKDPPMEIILCLR